MTISETTEFEPCMFSLDLHVQYGKAQCYLHVHVLGQSNEHILGYTFTV